MTQDQDSDQDLDLDVLTRLSDRLSETLGAIGDDQLKMATPCGDWNLSALIDHVTGGNWFTVQILDGRTAEEALKKAMSQFGGGSASPQAAASSVDQQHAAFQRSGTLEPTWHHVAGDLTGRQILRLRLHDLIVHTWDIEQTLDPPASPPGDLIRWGVSELADVESLAAKHFALASIPDQEDTEDPAAAYLGSFGRSVTEVY